MPRMAHATAAALKPFEGGVKAEAVLTVPEIVTVRPRGIAAAKVMVRAKLEVVPSGMLALVTV